MTAVTVEGLDVRIPTLSYDGPAPHAIVRSLDLATPAATAFAMVCDVEKWPVWLSFLKSSRRVDPASPLNLGSEVAIRSNLPGDDEELFEVERFIANHHVLLVGAYSCRRKIDLRIEQKSQRSRIAVRVDYPTYGGSLPALIDRLTRRRKLETELADSLIHFKGLIEFDRGSADQAPDDF
jgi:hypothetical protein